jgi:serine protease AprX
LIRWTKAPWARLALTLAFIAAVAAPALAAKGTGKSGVAQGRHAKLDDELNRRSLRGSGTSRVIVTFKAGWGETDEIRKHGSKVGRRLRLINGRVVEVPNSVLKRLADHPAIESIHYDRPTAGQMNRTAVTVGARAVQSEMGYTGAGVGVAVIDSGITSWHDDLGYNGSSSAVRTKAGQRVTAFVDFVNDATAQYDDYGHGTHVAGTIAGNGYDSHGARAGIAPDAHLVGLKVLDENGRGVISDVIAALDWIVANKSLHNIRVANLSVGAAVTESYRSDPLTLATKRAVEAGIVVVAAAGNLGRDAYGRAQYGAITAPGNAPWVLTVGAYSNEGTVTRTDDVMASYSSRGPTAKDFEAKPDVVAPGTGQVSLSDPTSTFYVTKASHLLKGSRPTAYRPYLSLSGTSMAAPVVSGTVALMMQANPSLTPNLTKAIIQYTAQVYRNYDSLTQGAGFLNTRGAVELARFYRTARAGDRLRVSKSWSRQILWGNHRLTRGALRPNANAWKLSTVWGSAVDGFGDNIVWGTILDGDNIVWGTFDTLTNIVWGTLLGDNGDNIVWGTFLDGDNIVWGTLAMDDNIVWGTDCGGANCDNIVWGTSLQGLDDNIVWGTAEFAENIVWGTSGEVSNEVWATSSADEGSAPAFDDPNAVPAPEEPVPFDQLFPPELAPDPPPPPPPAPDSGGIVTGITGALTGLTGGL